MADKKASQMTAEELLVKQAADRERKRLSRQRQKERAAAQFSNGGGDEPQAEVWKHNRAVMERDKPKEFKRLLALDEKIRDAKWMERHILIDGNPPIDDGRGGTFTLDVADTYREILALVREGHIRQYPEWVCIPGARQENFDLYVRAQAQFPEYCNLGFMTKYPITLHANYDPRAQRTVNLDDLARLVRGEGPTTFAHDAEPRLTAVGVPSDAEIEQLAKSVQEAEDRARMERNSRIEIAKNSAMARKGNG